MNPATAPRMSGYEDYCRSFKGLTDDGTFDYAMHDHGFCILQGQEPLLTPGGHMLIHDSEILVRQMLTDLQLPIDPGLRMLSSPFLFAWRLDMLDNGSDPLRIHWDQLVASDPFVQIKTTGKPARQPFSPDDPLFSFSFTCLSELIGRVNDFTGRMMGEIIQESDDHHPFPGLMETVYHHLQADRKAALQALSSTHHSLIVLPLMLVSDSLTPVEYANGLISLNIRGKEEFGEILAGTALVQSYLEMMQERPGGFKPVNSLIRCGEGDFTEFKSTLRWDLRAGKTNPAIERACLKSISAFLNSQGGSLLIGVRDDGSVEGIESDRFANEDKFLLHLWNLIRVCLGKDTSPFIHATIGKVDDRTVCHVECLPSPRPVFLRQPGFDEEFFIRVGPSSNALTVREALQYFETRFPRMI